MKYLLGVAGENLWYELQTSFSCGQYARTWFYIKNKPDVLLFEILSDSFLAWKFVDFRNVLDSLKPFKPVTIEIIVHAFAFLHRLGLLARLLMWLWRLDWHVNQNWRRVFLMRNRIDMLLYFKFLLLCVVFLSMRFQLVNHISQSLLSRSESVDLNMHVLFSLTDNPVYEFLN